MLFLIGAIFIIIIVYAVLKGDEKKPYSDQSLQRDARSNNRPFRTSAQKDIQNWLGENITDIVVFDTETNGLDPEHHSVLSVGAIRFSWVEVEYLKEVGRFERFYFPKEPYNEAAIKVNGLDRETIESLRGDCDYPMYYNDDPAFKEFCKGVRLFVGHNISFDAGFIPFVKRGRKFDTMKVNADIVCTEWNDYYENWKWPKLSETAEYYSIPFDDTNAHHALYDSEVTSLIFLQMLIRADIRVRNNP